MNVNLDVNELDDYTPEGIALTLFTHEPGLENSYQIIAEQELADLPYIFEILTIILMEGLEILTGDLSLASLQNLSSDHILAMNPWFRSLGFNISVDVYNANTDDKNLYNKHYSKIIMKDKAHGIVFEAKDISKNYHFFLNGDNLEENENKTQLKDLHAILLNDDTVFKISFDLN
jgi:hypothetical protein